MTGPFDKLSPQMAQEFSDSVIGAICTSTGLSLQNRIQHAHVDLFTDYEVKSILQREAKKSGLNPISCF